MTINKRELMLGAFAATVSSAAAAVPAAAQNFPSKPIRIIAPFAAGGNVDVTARLVGEAMSRQLGQSVIIDNRPGAGGVVGNDATLAAPADGYTLVVGAFGTLYVAPLMAGKPSMIPSFAPVSMLSTVPMVVDVPANSRFADWKALMAEAKAKPGTVTLGHAGNGTSNHTDILLIQLSEKVTFNIVPYRGSGVGLNDVMAGQIDGYVDQLSTSLPHIKSGKLRPLLIIGPQRVAELPDVPSLADVGIPPFDGGTTLGMFVRSETPKPIIMALNAAIVAALDVPAVRQRLTELGAVVRPSTPEELIQVMKADEKNIGGLAKLGLLKPE
ncbi:Bug family tripartite tricarboxylate transporter substrate binding protein [Reyranella sp.]|uniref:Bug family tripartite tricarboxylate transporter substrate binding protein n=1 Tax=Reyranella sp. TaxID=1929291 RepID=UPI003D0D87C7